MASLQIPQEFKCRRCGYCCKSFGFELHFTQKDIDFWEDNDLDWDLYPNWSPDGAKILFQRPGDSIMIMDANGSNLVDLTPDIPGAYNPDWAISLGQPVGGLINPVTVFPILAPFVIAISLFSAVILVVISHCTPVRQIPSKRDQ